MPAGASERRITAHRSHEKALKERAEGCRCGQHHASLAFAAVILAAVNVGGLLLFGLALGAWIAYELKD